MIHKWCTLFEFTISRIYTTYTYTSQTTIDIRMRWWLAKWCALFESTIPAVYSPPPTHTHYVIHKLLYTSGCMLGSQVMQTVRVHNPKCIFHKNTRWTSWCMYGSQLMHTVLVNYSRHIFPHTHHLIHRLVWTSRCMHGSQVMLTVRVHSPLTHTIFKLL